MYNYMYDISQVKGNVCKRTEAGVKRRSHNKKLLKIRKPKTKKYK